MYATPEDVQGFVWLQYPVEKIQQLLNLTQGDVSSVIWDIKYWPKLQSFSVCSTMNKVLYFDNIQIEEILEINWKKYTWRSEIIKPQKRGVIIYDLLEYIDYNRVVFDVKYLSWYKVIPDDIKLAHTLIVADMLTSWWGNTMSEYKMWPRTVKYDTSSSNTYQDKANKILNRYRMFKI